MERKYIFSSKRERERDAGVCVCGACHEVNQVEMIFEVHSAH